VLDECRLVSRCWNDPICRCLEVLITYLSRSRGISGRNLESFVVIELVELSMAAWRATRTKREGTAVLKNIASGGEIVGRNPFDGLGKVPVKK
jgi:hypothetical protein